MSGTPFTEVTTVPAPRKAVAVEAVSEVIVTTDGPGGCLKITVATVPATYWPVMSPTRVPPCYKVVIRDGTEGRARTLPLPLPPCQAARNDGVTASEPVRECPRVLAAENDGVTVSDAVAVWA